MRRLLGFNNGLLTDVSTSGSERSFKKRCTFKNGILTNIIDTEVPTTGFRSLSFRNGFLTGIGGEVYSDPVVYLGETIEHTMSVTSYSGWKHLPPVSFEEFTVDPYLPITIGTEVKGLIFGMKDFIYTYPDTGYPYSYHCDMVYPDDPVSTHIYGINNRSYVARGIDSDLDWWNDPSIEADVLALVDDFAEGTPGFGYANWFDWSLKYISDIPTVFDLWIGAYCDSRNVGGTTFGVTFFWAPIYYGIPPF